MKMRLSIAAITVLCLTFSLTGAERAGAEDIECTYFAANGDHNWYQYAATEPTCTEPGYTYLVCQECGTEDTIVTPATGHTWEDSGVSDPSTCTHEGWKLQHCTQCGAEQTIALPLAAHDWKAEESKESTCTEQGYVKYVCSVCSQTYTEPRPLSPHSYDAWRVTTSSTDHSMGIRTRTCYVCGHEETEYFHPEGTLYRGCPGGPDVIKLQQMLIDLGYLSDTADGSFGKKTEAAVKAFQEAKQLTADGLAWPQTLRELTAEWEAKSEAAAEAGLFCHREEADGQVTRICWCEEHKALAEQEQKAAANDPASLKKTADGWAASLESLYDRLGQAYPDMTEDISTAKERFFAMLDQSDKAGDPEDTEALRRRIQALRCECSRICGILGGDHDET